MLRREFFWHGHTGIRDGCENIAEWKKTAVVKDDASWQLSLSGLMKLGTEEDTGDGADVEGGMDYKDYVRMLLFLEDKGN